MVGHRAGREVGVDVEVVDRPFHLKCLEDHGPGLVDVERESLVVGVDQGDEILEVIFTREGAFRSRHFERLRGCERGRQLTLVAKEVRVKTFQGLNQNGGGFVLQALPDVRGACRIAEVRAGQGGQIGLKK